MTAPGTVFDCLRIVLEVCGILLGALNGKSCEAGAGGRRAGQGPVRGHPAGTIYWDTPVGRRVPKPAAS